MVREVVDENGGEYQCKYLMYSDYPNQDTEISNHLAY